MQTGYAVATTANLRAITSSRRIDGMAKTIVAKKKWYQYDAIATGLVDDDDTILIPDDNIGAWLVMHPSDGSGGGGGGGSALATVQNGKPTGASDTGSIVADSRSDRGTLWVKTSSDWQPFGFRSIYRSVDQSVISSDYDGSIDNYIDTITPDFPGQILVIYESFPGYSYMYYYISLPEIVTTRTSGFFKWIELHSPQSFYDL
jgi:hypothetical protein